MSVAPPSAMGLRAPLRADLPAVRGGERRTLPPRPPTREFSRQARPRIRLLAVAVVVALLVPLACGDFREDEFECEQAVMHLSSCCPTFDATKVRCTYSSGCGSTTYPALSLAESTCIESRDCTSIIGSQLCERAQKVTSTVVNDDGGVVSSHSGICP